MAFDKCDTAARQQCAADRWVNSSGADAVGKHEGLRIEDASQYEEAVAGGRSGQAYEVPYKNTNPRGRPHVYFDGEVGGVPVDANTAIVTRAKTVDQARRQAEALRQSQAIGVWKVPTETEARRARRMMERAKAEDTIFIVVEKP